MPSRSLRLLLAFGLCSHLVPVFAATDLTGTWIGTIPKKGRIPAKDVAFRLVQDGSALGGKAYNDAGASDPIVSGNLNDGRIVFEVEAREQAGNQINIVVYKFEGALAGEGIEITREKAAARDAASGAAIPVRRPGDSDEEDRARRFIRFKLERLFR